MTRHDFISGPDRCLCQGCSAYRCSVGRPDPDCACDWCSTARSARILAKCAEIERTHWAFRQAENDDGRMVGAGMAVLLMRASLFNGVAPEWRDPEEREVSGTVELEQTVASVRRSA